MVTSKEIKDIADEAMGHLLELTQIANEQQRDSKLQLDLYMKKNQLRNSITKLWKIAAHLRIEEQAQKGVA